MKNDGFQQNVQRVLPDFSIPLGGPSVERGRKCSQNEEYEIDYQKRNVIRRKKEIVIGVVYFTLEI